MGRKQGQAAQGRQNEDTRHHSSGGPGVQVNGSPGEADGSDLPLERCKGHSSRNVAHSLPPTSDFQAPHFDPKGSTDHTWKDDSETSGCLGQHL